MPEKDFPDPEDAEEDQLFIRVPEYKNILKDLEGVKQIMANMRESVEVLNEVQQVKERSIEVFRENEARLEKQLDDIEDKVPEVHDIEIHIDEDTPIEEAEEDVIDESVQELRGELDQLRDEMGRLE
ncbi:MAG: hypothetical protein MUP63_03100 [Candidatus Nanohaloarchaeota archaeon QJJ-7]|nr:hypothetical protein [Candidatus Nanohaloarchaeota archaeon QJJ-7]